MIFLDETHIASRTARRTRARAPRGKAPILLQADIPGLRDGFSLIAACNHHGFIVEACYLFSHSNTRENFELYVRDFLVPILRPYPGPNSIVVLDNASIHHGGEIEQLIAARGSKVIYLSPYSFDYNPIEKMFAQLKKYLIRNSSLLSSSSVSLEVCVWKGLGSVSQTQAIAYFRNALLVISQRERKSMFIECLIVFLMMVMLLVVVCLKKKRA